MLSTSSAILSAKKRVYIVTPYFIPVETVLNAIKQAGLSGIDVRLYGAKIRRFGSGECRCLFLLRRTSGEQSEGVLFYKKGFIHAKTMIVDDHFSSVGTANMDVVSQELNFEVNTLIFDAEINLKLKKSFIEDMNDCEEIFLDTLEKRLKFKVFEHRQTAFSLI